MHVSVSPQPSQIEGLDPLCKLPQRLPTHMKKKSQSLSLMPSITHLHPLRAAIAHVRHGGAPRPRSHMPRHQDTLVYMHHACKACCAHPHTHTHTHHETLPDTVYYITFLHVHQHVCNANRPPERNARTPPDCGPMRLGLCRTHLLPTLHHLSTNQLFLTSPILPVPNHTLSRAPALQSPPSNPPTLPPSGQSVAADRQPRARRIQPSHASAPHCTLAPPLTDAAPVTSTPHGFRAVTATIDSYSRDRTAPGSCPP